MAQTIVVIETDESERKWITQALGNHVQFVFFQTLEPVKEYALKNACSLIILGHHQSVRNTGENEKLVFISEMKINPFLKSTPIVVVSKNDSIAEKVTALQLGAEDYLVYQMDPMEFQARVYNKLRKASTYVIEERVMARGELEINVPNYSASISSNGKKVELDLTPIEYKILIRLAKQPGHILTRKQIIESVWGMDTEIEDRSVDKHISSLRKKLGGDSKFIRTVSGLGYQFVQQQQQQPSRAL